MQSNPALEQFLKSIPLFSLVEPQVIRFIHWLRLFLVSSSRNASCRRWKWQRVISPFPGEASLYRRLS